MDAARIAHAWLDARGRDLIPRPAPRCWNGAAQFRPAQGSRSVGEGDGDELQGLRDPICAAAAVRLNNVRSETEDMTEQRSGKNEPDEPEEPE